MSPAPARSLDADGPAPVPGAAAPPRRWHAAIAALLAGYAVLVVLTAWVSDDAFITFRTVENVVDGFGPRWNADDRVQTYTHPLWMWLMAGLRALSGELYFTSLAASFGLSLATLLLLARYVAADARAAVLALALLASSRAFVDYSTSGLENPLSHLLLVVFVAVLLRSGNDAPRLRALSLVASLLACTRTDLLFMVLPPLLWAAWRARGWRAWSALAAGFVPFLGWVAFATFYYGFPYPNTAAAKLLCLGVPAADLLQQGLLYLWTSARHDPVTGLGLTAGLAAALWVRGPCLWLAVGVLAQLAYVARIGGDFMLGRFLSAPLVVAVACLAQWRPLASTKIVSAGLVAIAATALCAPRVTWLSNGRYQGQGEVAHAIYDERGSHYGLSGLLSPVRFVPEPGVGYRPPHWQGEVRREVRQFPIAGGPGFVGGRLVHIVDPLICDPLLARLPALDPKKWRVGHTPRRVPEGYFESVATGENHIVNARLARYYEALARITRAPLFDAKRLQTIWTMLRGGYDADLQAFVDGDYRTPPVRRVRFGDLARSIPRGTHWTEVASVVICEGGVDVAFDAPVTASACKLGLHANGAYRLRFLRQGEELAVAEIHSAPSPLPILVEQRCEVPPGARAGFDRLHVDYVLDRSTDPIGVLAALALVE